MDWEQLREKTLGEVGTALASEGIGVAGGFLGAAFVGRQVENILVKTPVTEASSATEKIVAWVANNAPKVGLWYLLRDYAVHPGEEVTPTKEIASDARKAMSGSLVFDTVLRLANHGVNPATVNLWGYQIMTGNEKQAPQADVQRLIQENSALRAELNKALQRLAAPAPTPAIAPVHAHQPQAPVHVSVHPQQPVRTAAVPRAAPAPAQAPAPVVRYQPVQAATPAPRAVAPAPVVRYQPVQTQQPPAVYDREKEYGFMQPPAVEERERRYGFMQYETTPPAVQERQRKYGFASMSEEKDIAKVFGML